MTEKADMDAIILVQTSSALVYWVLGKFDVDIFKIHSI